MGPYDNGSTYVELDNYSDQDVVDASEILSGFDLVDTNLGLGAPNFELQFFPTVCSGDDPIGGHFTDCDDVTPEDKVLFAGAGINPWTLPCTVPPDKVNSTEIDILLAHLAESPMTANFVVRKLYRHFISEEEPALDDPLIVDAVVAWLSSGGNIGLVLYTLLNSDRMRTDTGIRWSLARTPLEIYGQFVAVHGAPGYDPTDPDTSLAELIWVRATMRDIFGQNLFNYPAPGRLRNRESRAPHIRPNTRGSSLAAGALRALVPLPDDRLRRLLHQPRASDAARQRDGLPRRRGRRLVRRRANRGGQRHSARLHLDAHRQAERRFPLRTTS